MFPFVIGSCFTCSLSIFFTFGVEGIFPFSIVAKMLPSETLSPILTLRSFISPEEGDGISRLDLSLSIVTIGSFLFTLSPGLQNFDYFYVFKITNVRNRNILSHKFLL